MIGFPCCLVCFYKFRGILPEPKCYINLYFQISFSIKDIVILLLLACFFPSWNTFFCLCEMV